MRVLIFGATGMVGQGVLRECLLAHDVERVTTVGRTALAHSQPKLHDLRCDNLRDLTPIASELTGFDACFFCLGVSSSGMSEAQYTALTYDLTLAVANFLVRLNPALVFVYVSGEGTDSSEQGRSMWARVKGRTENALLKLPFGGAYMFRPGVIAPLDGIVSKTKLYRIFYTILGPVIPVVRRLAPNSMTTTRRVGRAMLQVVRAGHPNKILHTREINQLGQGQA